MASTSPREIPTCSRIALGLETRPEKELEGFADGEQVAGWAADDLAWAVEQGLLTGKDGGRLDPAGTATRAEVAAVLERMSRLLETAGV